MVGNAKKKLANCKFKKKTLGFLDTGSYEYAQITICILLTADDPPMISGAKSLASTTAVGNNSNASDQISHKESGQMEEEASGTSNKTTVGC